MRDEEHFFVFAAEAGLTKHLQGVESTDELAQLRRIDEDGYVLGVGCGVGTTPGVPGEDPWLPRHGRRNRAMHDRGL